MATINLGRVKGDPFTYDDFTPEQLAGLKGESFKFEDFSEEQLDSITPKIEVGTVTTLDAGSQATVTPKVNGNTTTFDFGIPKGQDFNLEKIDSRTDLMANTEVGKLADALAIKEAITEVDKPDIANYTDLMANSVSGYNADALAVKEGFTNANNNSSKYSKNIPLVSDLLAEAAKGNDACVFVKYNVNTLNSPYIDGYAGTYTAGTAIINMSGSDYGQILAFPAGTAQVFNRYKTINGWSNWKCLNPTEYEVYGSNKVSGDAGSHNCVYRGRYLGEVVTEAQYASIAAGTFDNLYIGDYWGINNVRYRIAAFDYYYNTGDTVCTKHHVVVVPDKPLYNHVMNDEKTTVGAYVGSKLYIEGLEQAKTIIKNAFGSEHILSHKIYLVNAMTDGYASGAAWYDSEVELMTEQMVYGSSILLPTGDGMTVYSNHRVEKSQLPLFFYRPDIISNRSTYWLRDVISPYGFTCVGSVGRADTSSAENTNVGVRPSFCIC